VNLKYNIFEILFKTMNKYISTNHYTHFCKPIKKRHKTMLIGTH